MPSAARSARGRSDPARPTTVAFATIVSESLMGQHEYEEAIARHLRHPSIQLRRVSVRPMRSALPGTARLPFGILQHTPRSLQAALAAATYGAADLVHRCDLRLPAPVRREVVTIHDTAWLRFDDEASPLRGYDIAARRALRVIVPSEFAAGEVVRGLGVLPERVRVIPNGFDPAFSAARPLREDELARDGLPRRFVLHSGGCSKRKNVALLAGAWVRVAAGNSDLHLLLCGPPDPRREELFRGLPRVRYLGVQPRERHARLTASAVCVVVPSLYEGFGLPALEAMAAGTPVVAVSGSALDEVVGDAGVLVSPSEPEFADAVERLAREPELARAYGEEGRAQARRFSWERSANTHAETYLEVAGRPPSSST